MLIWEVGHGDKAKKFAKWWVKLTSVQRRRFLSADWWDGVRLTYEVGLVCVLNIMKYALGLLYIPRHLSRLSRRLKWAYANISHHTANTACERDVFGVSWTQAFEGLKCFFHYSLTIPFSIVDISFWSQTTCPCWLFCLLMGVKSSNGSLCVMTER